MNDKIIISIKDQLYTLTDTVFSHSYIKKFILPIIHYITNSNKSKFLFSGSQGVGKSTLVEIIKTNVNNHHDKKVLILNLDNYYLTKKQRLELSMKEHLLLKTRGVPGSHDLKKLFEDIDSFDKRGYCLDLPIFNKLIDDRSSEKKNSIKADILILEGTCCGCPPIKEKYLFRNINMVEKYKDNEFIWRNYYNDQLINNYAKLFALFDKQIFLKAPSFSFIFNWRLKQEILNAKKNQSKVMMNKENLTEFLSHYEKITKWMLRNMNHADLILNINKNQKITKILYN